MVLADRGPMFASRSRSVILEVERSRKRRELFDAQDAIDRQRDELLGGIERQLRKVNRAEHIFMVRWTLT